MHENGKPASQITYNSVKEIVQHHKHMFLIRFGVEQRIQEIEKGGEGRGEEEEPADLLTKIILEYQYQIFKKLSDVQNGMRRMKID